MVDDPPICIHYIGAVSKKDGGLRPITDCRRPLGLSINNYMNTVCDTFHYVTVNNVVESTTEVRIDGYRKIVYLLALNVLLSFLLS